MRKYTDEIIHEIKLNNDIAGVVSEYVKLKQQGKDLFGLCPFHSEKTPSFSVAPSKGIYYCFGCHAGGDVVKFIMDVENLSYVEALDFLAKRANIVVPEEIDPIARKKAAEISIQKKIYIEAARFFYENLKTSDSAKKYLFKRKLDMKVIKKFGIGYAPYKGLFAFLKQKGFDEPNLMKSGLFGKKDGVYDRFRNRLIFPIFDVYGTVIAFGGRVLDDSKPKYLNSPETMLFHKGNHLYGLNYAKKTKKDYFILVEGYFDVVSMAKYGYDNCIACLGTALTLRQARMINRYSKKIFLAYDSDEAGQKATKKAIDIFRSLGVWPNTIVLDDGKDLDEYINNYGIKRFEACLKKSLDPIDYRVMRVLRQVDFDDVQSKVRGVKMVIRIISTIEDESLLEMYAQRYAKQLKISPDAMIQDAKRTKNNGKGELKEVYQTKRKIVEVDKMKESEIYLLLTVFHFNEGHQKAKDYFTKNGYVDEVTRHLHHIIDNTPDLVFSDLCDDANEDIVPKMIEYSRQIETMEDPKKAIEDMINKLYQMKIEIDRNNILNHIDGGGELDEKTKKQLLELQNRLKKQKSN